VTRPDNKKETTVSFVIRPITERDFFPWHELYEGYGEFYETPLHDQKAVLVWTWLTSDAHEVEALVAENDEGRLVGLAHFREFARPLAGGKGIHLDDLFVAPDARGQGVGTALIEAVKKIAADRHAGIVRLITAADNTDAQKLYDSVGEKTSWITYDLTV
jgi:ribosomal protein S18 acetylase RimI-like enzyme